MKRHSTDLVSLVFGVIFLAASGWWLAGRYVHLDVPHLGWITAAVLIGLGLLGLFGSLRGERTERTEPGTAAPAPAAMTRPTSAPPAFRPANEPAFRPADEPTFRPADAPAFRPADEPAFRPADEPSERRDERDEQPAQSSHEAEGPDDGPQDAPGTDIR